MATKPDDPETQRKGAFMQALANEYGMLQGARGATI